MKTQDSLTVILNPAAGGGRGARLLSKVENGLRSRGISFSLSQTRGKGDAKRLCTEAIQREGERILVVGGDGTVHEVANAILEAGRTDVAMAVAPVGTGNDFFRMVSPARKLTDALDILVEGQLTLFDVGRVRSGGKETFFVNLLGVGLDVEVLRRRAGFRRLSGLPQYLAALAVTIFSYRPIQLRMVLDGGKEVLEGDALLAGLTLGPSIGGGFLLSPDATPTDGFLDLFFVDPLGAGRVARYLPRVIRGTHRDLSEFHFRKVREVDLHRPDEMPFFFELDGELMPEPTTRLEIEVYPKALPVLLPLPGKTRA